MHPKIPINEIHEKEFPGQQAGENLEMMTTLHWVTMVPYFAILGFISFIIYLGNNMLYWIYGEDVSMWLIIFFDSIYILILWHLACIRILNYFLQVILVTNYRLLSLNSSTVLQRETKMIDFLNVQDIECIQKGIVQRVLNYGTITIHNAAGDELFIFEFVPRPTKFYNRLNHIYRKAQPAKISSMAKPL